MAMKVEQGTLNSSPGASTSSSKVSKFGVKSGFVIPKNKLSGSLVPIFRGAKKVESGDAGKEEINKQVQRKTKWGTDLTQDSSVRRGRALAYQTRVEQITEQLKSGVLGTGEDQDSSSPTGASKESSSHKIDDQYQKLEALELEKREAIGEILKLNPTYKAPHDYKPLLKEAKVPIPLKLYPGFNFIGLLLGSGSNTQKRLEEETGAKLRIQGTKVGESEKGEITLSDGSEDQSAYEDLFVHVSADTFEKVDAAVALIELLVTPVSGNPVVVSTPPAPVPGDNINVTQTQNVGTSYATPAAIMNPGMMQTMMGSTHPSLPQIQFQPYSAPWVPLGQSHTQMRPPSGIGAPLNSAVNMPNNTIQFPPSPLNPSRMPPMVGRPQFAMGFGLVPRNSSFVPPRPQPQQQGLQPYFPETQPCNQVPHMRAHPIPGPQSPQPYQAFPLQRNSGPPHQFSGNQIRTNQQFSVPQPLSTVPSGQPPYRPVSSAGWPTTHVANPTPQSNMTQVSSSIVPSQRPPLVPQPVLSGTSGPSSGSMISSAGFASQHFTPQLPNAPNMQPNRPVTATPFSSLPPQVGFVPASPSTTSTAGVPSPSSGVLRAPLSMAPPVPASPSLYPRTGTPAVAQAGPPAPASISSLAPNQSPLVAPRPVGPQGPAPNISMPGSGQVPLPVPLASPRSQQGSSNSISVSLPSFTPVKPPLTSPQSISPVTAPKPPRPSSGDFTFQPLGSQSQASRPSTDQASSMQTKPTMVQPPVPQAPSYRPAMHNPGPQQIMQGFPSSRPTNQFLQPQTPVLPPSPGSTPFSGNQSPMGPPPRSPAFSNRNPVPPTSSAPQMGPLGFMQTPQMSNMPGPLPSHMTTPQQLQHNQSAPTIRPGNVFVPNQQYSNIAFSSKPASSPGGNQVYDPFSPTSISSGPQQIDNPGKGRKHENDPEYDDLMASVGMR